MSQSQNAEHSPLYLGALARREGRSPTDNPYSLGEQHSEWMLGWTHARWQATDVSKSQPNRSPAPVFKIDVERFNSPSSLRLRCWGMVLRLALLAGHPVVLIGACRTGKTLLLEKLTPGKIIDKREEAMRGGKQLVISADDVTNGIYSIDECQRIEPYSLVKLIGEMAIHKRKFCLSAQRYGDIKEALDVYRSNEKANRVVLIVVGGQQNPKSILQELPR